MEANYRFEVSSIVERKRYMMGK